MTHCVALNSYYIEKLTKTIKNCNLEFRNYVFCFCMKI